MVYIDKTDDIRYRDLIIEKVIIMCSFKKFKYVTNFAWYISILVDLAYMKGSKHGKEISNQLLDVVIRVPDVRQYAVETVTPLLSDSAFLDGTALPEVLCAASWIVGEYSSTLSIKEHTDILKVLLRPETMNLSPSIQALFIQCVIKLYISLVKKIKSGEDGEETEDTLLLKLREVAMFIVINLEPYVRAYDVEVQERASSIQNLLILLDPCVRLQINQIRNMEENPEQSTQVQQEQQVQQLVEAQQPVEGEQPAEVQQPAEGEQPVEMPVVLDENGNPLPASSGGIPLHELVLLADIEFEELEPVSSKAIKKVPVPEGLDLDKWVNEPYV